VLTVEDALLHPPEYTMTANLFSSSPSFVAISKDCTEADCVVGFILTVSGACLFGK
jgi:hypothetical protein